MSKSVYLNFTVVFPEGGREDLVIAAAAQMQQLLEALAGKIDDQQSSLVILTDGILCQVERRGRSFSLVDGAVDEVFSLVPKGPVVTIEKP